MKKSGLKYLIEDRLSDVITLIVMLAIDKSNFKTEESIVQLCQSQPLSSDKWLTIAKDHPEFFRMSKEKTSAILLIRFAKQRNVKNGKLRPPLSLEETQQLVDQALELSGKQLALYQKDAHRTAVWSAYIAAAATIIAGVISLIVAIYGSNDIKSELQDIKRTLHKFEQPSQVNKKP